MNHLHFHIFPRLENETKLFPVPQPNIFDGFTIPIDEEITVIVQALQ